MTYVMSDIHGCYDKYLDLLKKISFKDDDVLYVLGDVIDRGDKPVEVLLDMSMRANIFPIAGNHEGVALKMLKKLLITITTENYTTHIDTSYLQDLELWISIGGRPTLDGFGRLSMKERKYIFDYMSEFSLYETVRINGKTFILTHSGIPEGAKPDNLDSYDPYDFLSSETDYNKKYFDDIFLVTGHLPTLVIDKKYRGRIYRANNHIAIDTGAVFGERMGCICLDTDEEFYV